MYWSFSRFLSGQTWKRSVCAAALRLTWATRSLSGTVSYCWSEIRSSRKAWKELRCVSIKGKLLTYKSRHILSFVSWIYMHVPIILYAILDYFSPYVEPIWLNRSYAKHFNANRKYNCPSLDDRIFKGELMLQNLPSVLAVDELDPQPGQRVLDMCAAPGGKTMHIASRYEITSDYTP